MSQLNRIYRSILALSLAMGALALGGCGLFNSTPRPDAPPRGVNLYVQGVEAYHAGNTDAATDKLEQATRVNPDLRMAHSILGDIYRAKGDYPAARGHY